MHRSGTSAVTGLLVQLGLHGPGAEDVPAVTRWNARGNFESARLIRFNDQMLIDHGGSWGRTAVRHRLGDGSRGGGPPGAAARIIGKVFGSDPFVFKDPRNCLTCPSGARSSPARRRRPRVPESVGGGGIDARPQRHHHDHGLALWERYVRSSMAGLDGVPTLVVGFDRVLDDALTWCGELTEFLGGVGIGCDASALDRARAASTAAPHVHHTTPQVGGSTRPSGSSSRPSANGTGAPAWAAPTSVTSRRGWRTC